MNLPIKVVVGSTIHRECLFETPLNDSLPDCLEFEARALTDATDVDLTDYVVERVWLSERQITVVVRKKEPELLTGKGKV